MKPHDTIPETVAEALAMWDANELVATVEMGGIGPSYEQAIQIMAFEIMRVVKDFEWPPIGADDKVAVDKIEAASKIADAAILAASKPMGGVTVAMADAAKTLAFMVCRRGYRAALRMPEAEDRLIFVTRRFPNGRAS